VTVPSQAQAEQAEPADDAEPAVGLEDVHDLLLRLAGRVPGGVLRRARERLAGIDLAPLAEELTDAVLAAGEVLTHAEVATLAALLETCGLDPTVLAGAPMHWAGAPTPYLFSRSGPPDAPGGPALVRFLSAAAGDGPVRSEGGGLNDYDKVTVLGLRGVWLSWRSQPGSPDAPTPVYVAEVEWDAAIAVTAVLQRVLVAAGEEDPQVEAYEYDGEPPLGQQLARLHGTLLWAREPAQELRTARLFDHLDLERGPSFAADHPVMAEASEAQKVLDYLYNGAPLPINTLEQDDAVNRQRSCVPTIVRTDGSWIWTDSTAYYLQEYGLEPDAELLAHIRANNYEWPEVDGVALHRALAASR
jgi:hypothetical protein